jgi:psp operon transcriptional activator
MELDTALVGRAAVFLDVLDRVSAAAALNRPVLILGERGTGKELVAERLHRLSARWDQPYVTLNCATLAETLLDAELFGAEAGAYTGANRARLGRFEEADGGTLFLDEIATLSAQAQEKLLRVIEYGQLQRLGANKTLRVDVRVLGATNEDLPRLVAEGRFRADLLDRLSFEVITLPPLRARAEDILVLASHFARRMAAELGWPGFIGFTPQVEQALQHYGWPGNVRELKNVVERSVYRWTEADAPVGVLVLDPFDSRWRLAQERGNPGVDAPAPSLAPHKPDLTAGQASAIALPCDFRANIAAYEKNLLEQALRASRYNQRQAATLLGLSYDQVRHALRKAGLL